MSTPAGAVDYTTEITARGLPSPSVGEGPGMGGVHHSDEETAS